MQMQRDRESSSEETASGTTSAAAVVDSGVINVRVAQIGREIVDLKLPKGTSLQQALDKAGLTALRGLEVRVNNVGAGMDRELKDGEIVTLIPDIRGGTEIVTMAITVSDASGNLLDIVWLDQKRK